jgi:hypothetical protein
MKIEKLDRVVIGVRSLDKAEKLFSKLFGIKFERSPIHTMVKTLTEHADQAFKKIEYRNVAIAPVGLELIETSPPVETEGIRSFHFKVSNLEEAKIEMEEKGIHLVAEVTHGGLKEAIFSPEDLHGARIVLVEYEAPTVISAILQK